jgi:L-lactate dehydrogenase complex protein LldG
MSISAGSRETILGRVRGATKAVAKSTGELADAYAAISREYVRRGAMTDGACLELFIERLREYDAEVVETTDERLAAAIAAQLAASGRQRFVAPAALPAAWLAEGFDWKLDGDLSTAEIEQAEGVVTAAFCGVAESGTIVLHHSATEGRRVITLLPDWHLCVIYASQVVETLPEYFDRCDDKEQGTGNRDQGAEALGHLGDEDLSPGTPPKIATYISGPSATADIEMTRIKGVHGPRFLNVIVVRDSGHGAGNRE